MNMSAEEIINLVNNSKSIIQVFPDMKDWKSNIKEYLLKVHTDRCSLPGAQDATTKLLEYKNQLENGLSHHDDAGKIIYFSDHCIIHGDKILLKKSMDNFSIIKRLLLNNHPFEKYFPINMELKDNELYIEFKQRAVPIVSIPKLPQEHLNWVLSRILEVSAWLNNMGYSHNGMNPYSVYVIPQNHGIILTSFYHMTPLDSKLISVSGRYANFYPNIVFDNKIARSYIDIELAKRTVCSLGGDKSGVGMMFKNKKEYNKEWVDFVTTFDTEQTFLVFEKYRTLLDKNFEKKFYKLNI